MRYLIGWFMTRSLRIKLTVVGVLLLGAALLVFQQSLVDTARGWRADRLVAEAERHAEKDEWDEVERAARASMQLQPTYEGLRLLFGAFKRNGDPKILQAAAALFNHPEAERIDRLECVRVCLDYQDLVAGASMVGGLRPEERSDPELRYEILRFLLASYNHEAALSLVEELSEEERTPQLELLVASGLATSKDKEIEAGNEERMIRLLEGDDWEAARGVLRLLAGLSDERLVESDSLVNKALARFGDDPALEGPDRLRIDLLRVVLGRADREEVIEAAVNAHWDEHAEVVIGWLERLGESERIVELTDKAGAAGELTPALFERRARALDALERFDELARELDDPPVHIPEVPLLCARARLAAKREKEADALLLWQEVMALAGRDPNHNWYYQISQIARGAGNRDIAMEALARGIESRLGKPPTAAELPSLFEWLYEEQSTERLLRISARLLERQPGNPVLINNYHYLKILHGKVSEKDREALRGIVEAFPEEPGFASSLALALLKSDQPEAALEVLDELESEERPRSEAAIRAAALAKMGRGDESSAFAAQIDWEKFTSPEEQMLRELLAQAQ